MAFLVGIIVLVIVVAGLAECVSEFRPAQQSTPAHWTKDAEDGVWKGLDDGIRKKGGSNPYSRDCVMGIVKNDFAKPQSYAHDVEKRTSGADAMATEIRDQC